MTIVDSIFLNALTSLLTEVFDGPPGEEAYVVNPGDPGLLRQLDSIDANTASKRPMAGKSTIASHVDHLYYGIVMLNRWAAGDPNPWAGTDPNASWDRTTVSEEQWQTMRTAFRQAARQWRDLVAARTNWDQMSATVAISTAVHTAYHIGAIRQLLLGLRLGE